MTLEPQLSAMPSVLSRPQRGPSVQLTRRQRQLVAALAAEHLPNAISHFPSTEYVMLSEAEEDDPSLISVSQFISEATGGTPHEPPPDSQYTVNVFSVAVGPERVQQLDPDQLAELEALKSEFSDVISSSSDEVGCVPAELGIVHKIPTGDAPAQVQKP